MKALTINHLRTKMEYYFHEVAKTKEVIIMPEGQDEGVVIMPTTEYNSLQETISLLSSSTNAQRIISAINQMESNQLLPFQKN